MKDNSSDEVWIESQGYDHFHSCGVSLGLSVKCGFRTDIYDFDKWKLFWKKLHKPIQNPKIIVIWPNAHWTLADVCHREQT